jgi:undecaprenyl-diphosphatase
MEVNIHLFRMINDLGKEYTFLNPFFVFIAEYALYLVIGIAIIYLFTNNYNRLMVLYSIMAIFIAEVFGKLAGLVHQNNQPFAELANVNQLIEKTVDNSFPSDHTIIVFALCFSFWICKKGWNSLWVLLAILVGISRIWAGVHYPGDVAAGAFLSILSVLVVYRFVPRAIEKWFGKNLGESIHSKHRDM